MGFDQWACVLGWFLATTLSAFTFHALVLRRKGEEKNKNQTDSIVTTTGKACGSPGEETDAGDVIIVSERRLPVLPLLILSARLCGTY